MERSSAPTRRTARLSASSIPPMAKTAKKTAKPKNVVAEARSGGTKKNAQPFGKWLWENFKSIGGAVLIYLVVKTLFLEAFRIPSGSMIPTLLVGDWLFVNKLAYGPTISRPSQLLNCAFWHTVSCSAQQSDWFRLPGYTTPKHNDVVVFVSPEQPDEAARGADPYPTLVKR